jgi:hypothetical protein
VGDTKSGGAWQRLKVRLHKLSSRFRRHDLFDGIELPKQGLLEEFGVCMLQKELQSMVVGMPLARAEMMRNQATV